MSNVGDCTRKTIPYFVSEPNVKRWKSTTVDWFYLWNRNVEMSVRQFLHGIMSIINGYVEYNTFEIERASSI